MRALLGAPVQIAYVVPDVEEAAAEWAERYGAGPFFLRRHIAVTDVMYRGASSVFDHTSAYGQWGSIMVELVHDHGSAPSVVRERFAPHEGGLHHMAFVVDHLDDAIAGLRQRGYEVAMSAATANGTRFVFVDAMATHGHFFELYQRSERLAAFYQQVADAAAGWDGTEPVRE